MKTLLPALLLALSLPVLRAADAPAPLDAAFREALLLEEGRRDLPAALRAYEAVVAQVDAQRALAATAVCRLGEVHRKLGRTNEAVAQYRRLLRDFPAEETLAGLSRENLAALGAPWAERGGDAPVAEGVRGTPPRELAAEEIARLEAQLAELEKLSPDQPAALIALQQAFPDAQLVRIEADIFSVEQRLAFLRASLADEHPDVRGIEEQRLLLRQRLDLRWQAGLRPSASACAPSRPRCPVTSPSSAICMARWKCPPGGTLSLADSILRLKPTNLTDLRRVRVHRPAAAGGTNLIVEVNVRDLLRDNDRSKDVQLRPGDRVEIPHRVY